MPFPRVLVPYPVNSLPSEADGPEDRCAGSVRNDGGRKFVAGQVGAGYGTGGYGLQETKKGPVLKDGPFLWPGRAEGLKRVEAPLNGA